MPRLLRDLHRLAETPERLGEPPKRPERPREPVPHGRALDFGLPESVQRQALRDQRDRGLAVPDGLAALAPRQVHRAKIPVGDNLDGDVRLRLADGHGATSSLDRRPEIVGPPELDRLVVQRAAEAALVADGLCEGFGLVEEGPHPSLLAERLERVAEVEADIEGLGDRVGGLWQSPERVERLLEAGGRLAVGRSHEDLGAGLAQVAYRLVPDFALPRVVRQPLHVLDEAIGVQA
ncbi:MAG TPA: hypothetical protein VFX28_16960, partial [Methylomirabilota bacterium]|nr:hypothetical protein [Methylomirabilota bacterium]